MAAESAFFWNAETDAGARTARIFLVDMLEPPWFVKTSETRTVLFFPKLQRAVRARVTDVSNTELLRNLVVR
jgi:voltage-gated potassium channel Kch